MKILKELSRKEFHAKFWEENLYLSFLSSTKWSEGWSGYKPLKENFPNLTQIVSNEDQNFKMLHFQIRNFKNWLRGVHSYCEKEYINQYIQECFYRLNRLNFRSNILEKLLIRMRK